MDIGPGSPTGVVFGYGAKFPAKYQNAFYVSDWSYGKLYAVHLAPDGSSYTGTAEEFLSAQPLPLTDIIIHPKDGAMLGVGDGDRVEVRSRRGAIVLAVRLTPREIRGAVFVPFHFREAAANLLTLDELDPDGKIPEFKFCAVAVRRLET